MDGKRALGEAPRGSQELRRDCVSVGENVDASSAVPLNSYYKVGEAVVDGVAFAHGKTSRRVMDKHIGMFAKFPGSFARPRAFPGSSSADGNFDEIEIMSRHTGPCPTPTPR